MQTLKLELPEELVERMLKYRKDLDAFIISAIELKLSILQNPDEFVSDCHTNCHTCEPHTEVEEDGEWQEI